MFAADIDDTIVAIASAPGASLRGIVRISGSESANCLGRFFRVSNGLQLGQVDVATRLEGTLDIDSVLNIPASLLWWPTCRSYTRQPSAEIHLIGSGPLLQMVLEKCCECGARLAQPGEFTLRAFLSGRIDLTQAEAVLAVIDSKGQQQFDAALEQLAGGLGGPITTVRNSLLELLAELEAGLDFVEEDIQFITPLEIQQRLAAAEKEVESTLAGINDRAIQRELVRVVLIGKPNAGKSSLFNALVDGAAIVSEFEGTTRDYITATLEIDGTQVQLIDTAGVHDDSTGPRGSIHQMATEHTRAQMGLADIRLLCIDAAQTLAGWELELVREAPDDLIVVQTRCDIHDTKLDFVDRAIRTSIIDKTGLSELQECICKLAGIVQNADSVAISPAIARASESLVGAKDSIARAAKASSNQWGDEVVAVEVRAALDHLGRVVGTIYTDDILDVVFRRFCIGK